MPAPDDVFTHTHPYVAVANAEHAAHDLDKAFIDAELAPIEWRDAAMLLQRLRWSRQTLARLEGALEAHIAQAWRREGLRHDTHVDGVGTIRVNRSRQRSNWQHADLATAVINTHMEERGGEQPDPFEVRDWLMEAAGVGYWRVTPLRDHGIEPDDYCLSIPGHPTVQIT